MLLLGDTFFAFYHAVKILLLILYTFWWFAIFNTVLGNIFSSIDNLWKKAHKKNCDDGGISIYKNNQITQDITNCILQIWYSNF